MKAEDNRIVVPIEDVYLDPNNPRIVPIEKAKDTAVTDIKSESVQATTLKLMYENTGPGVKNYVERLQKEGLLPAFPLRASKLPGGGWVLNDGNTRIVAAKAILADTGVGKLKLDQSIISGLRNVTIEDVGPYGGSEWLKMQAKIHLQGPRTWASSKRAGFVMKVIRQRLTKAETMDILQVRQEVLSRYQNHLDAYFDLRLQFPTRINEGHFGVLKELVKSPACRRYLGWNAKRKTFTNKGHLAELVFLIAPDNGSKPKIVANTAKIFRNLGDDPLAWNTYVRGNEKQRKLVEIGGARNRPLYDMMMRLAQRLGEMRVSEASDFDIDLGTKLISMINRAKVQARAAANANSGKVKVA
jgi:hypothetical protein